MLAARQAIRFATGVRLFPGRWECQVQPMALEPCPVWLKASSVLALLAGQLCRRPSYRDPMVTQADRLLLARRSSEGPAPPGLHLPRRVIQLKADQLLRLPAGPAQPCLLPDRQWPDDHFRRREAHFDQICQKVRRRLCCRYHHRKVLPQPLRMAAEPAPP